MFFTRSLPHTHCLIFPGGHWEFLSLKCFADSLLSGTADLLSRFTRTSCEAKSSTPPYLHDDAVDLLSQLITSDLTKRLGNLHGGPDDVKNHAWFAEVTWDRLARKDIDAPYIPPIRGGQGDASQYDKYPEETEHYGQVGEDA